MVNGRKRAALWRTDFSPFGGGGEGGLEVRSRSEYGLHRKGAKIAKEEQWIRRKGRNEDEENRG